MSNEKLHFVTGRLAEKSLRNTLQKISKQSQQQPDGSETGDANFDFSIQVMPITVAALMTPQWLAARLEIPSDATRIMIPGYCDGDLTPLKNVTKLPIDVGPKDLRRLPEFFGQKNVTEDFGDWDIDIIAEINHAPRLELPSILTIADRMRNEGATLIDVGCEPDGNWRDVGEVVRALKSEGHRVSIDSLNPKEIQPAIRAGAELVLSVNATNRECAADWGCEVVVIPDDIRDIHSMTDTIDQLALQNVPLRIDPILEPIGLGFAASLRHYMQARDRWPEAEMMMGIGNITELTDVDSAGVNVLLLAICQEIGVRSVLTTEVINWARTSVKECDIARQLVHYAIKHEVPPKHLSPALVMLRDTGLLAFGDEQLAALANEIKDNNYRIFAESGLIHLLGSRQHFSDADPFEVFDELADTNPKNLDASHAFYLGYEMCKAMMANQLGKQYTQDEALDWGFLTAPETDRHRLKKRREKK